MTMKITCVFVKLFIVSIVFIGCGTDKKTDKKTDNNVAGYQVAKDSVSRAIPKQYIDLARTTLHIAYQHTSHGTQVARGLFGLPDFKKGDDLLFGITDKSPETGKLDFNDLVIKSYAAPGIDASDLSRNETAFIQSTRDFLDDTANSEINVIM